MPAAKPREPKESANGSSPRSRSQVQKEDTLCTAAEQLIGSVNAMRMALAASDSAAGELCLLPENEGKHEGPDLRRRWIASTALLYSAMRGVENNTKAVVDAVNDLLMLE